MKRFSNPPALLTASGTIAVGYLAIRSFIGKPLAYAEVFQSGRARLCRASSKKLSLPTKGLTGGAAGVFVDALDCDAPAHLFVQVRATLLQGARLSGFRQFLRTTAPLLRAELAVGTESGKPLAYSEVLASGRARLLTARGGTAS